MVDQVRHMNNIGLQTGKKISIEIFQLGLIVGILHPGIGVQIFINAID